MSSQAAEVIIKPLPLCDDHLPRVIKHIVQGLQRKDDDFLLMIVGTTGTGKSNLLMMIYEMYSAATGTTPSITQIALNSEDFAHAWGHVISDNNKFVGYDEANVNRREWASQYNRDLMKLYWGNRGLKVFNGWCNPSLEWIDRPFIEERIKGVIFIHTKGERYRKYWYFTKKSLLLMLEKYQNLKHHTLLKHGSKYALYEGFFTKYDGILKQDYLLKKQDKMTDLVGEFVQKYNKGEALSLAAAAKKLTMNEKTLKKYLAHAIELKIVSDDVKLPSGQYSFTKKHQEQLLFYAHNYAHKGGRAEFGGSGAAEMYIPREGGENFFDKDGER